MESAINRFSYGAPELKKVYRRYLSYGFFLAFLMHIVGIWVVRELSTSETPPTRVIRIFKYSELGPPPSISGSKGQTLEGIPVETHFADRSKSHVESVTPPIDQPESGLPVISRDRSSPVAPTQASEDDPMLKEEHVKLNRDFSEIFRSKDSIQVIPDTPLVALSRDVRPNPPKEHKEHIVAQDEPTQKTSNETLSSLSNLNWQLQDLSPVSLKEGREIAEIRSYIYSRLRDLNKDQTIDDIDNIKILLQPRSVIVLYPDGIAHKAYIPSNSRELIDFYVTTYKSSMAEIRVGNALFEFRKLKTLLNRVNF